MKRNFFIGAKLSNMVVAGDVSASASVTIFANMVETGRDPLEIANESDLVQKSDAGELEKIVDEVLAANQKAVEEIRTGGKKADKSRSFLVGQVMQKTKGQANPKIVSEILLKKLS